MAAVSLRSDFFHLAAQYGAQPEYLWARYPSYAVLRHSRNRKWFAVVMDVPRDRLGLDGTGRVELVDLKVDPLLSGSLREQPGILPAYHMHKGNWVSVLLDGTADWDLIAFLTEMSFRLTEK